MSEASRARAALGALGPDGALALVAIGVLAVMASALGGALVLPWDGIVPFCAIFGGLVGVGASVDLLRGVRGELAARQVRALRLWLPFAVVYLCYRALRGALPVVIDHGVEAELVRADIALLGASPAWWLERIHAPWLTELLALAYATMFFLPLAVLLALYARGHDRALRGVALSLQLAFYLGFIGFLLVPARSPDVVYAFPQPLVGYGFYEASMAAWRRLQAVTYDAFPSMHTAISTLALAHAVRFRHLLAPARRWLPALVIAPVVVLLQLATLYLRQHYAVDVIAGWGVAALAIVGASALARAWRC